MGREYGRTWGAVLLLALVGCGGAGGAGGEGLDDDPGMTTDGDDPEVATTITPDPSTGGEMDDDSGDAGDSGETGDDTGEPMDPPEPSGPRTVLVHLFEWGWPQVARECELVLGPSGIRGVQVSPPQEHAIVDGAPWWERYQPVSYQLEGRSGDEADFADMVARCEAVGVEIYVDAVINHMSAVQRGVGSAGSVFSKYDYPGLYADEHFHDCRHGISDWGSRYEIHNCELATLPDLATELPYVREQLTEYLQHLQDLGVAGFRVDAAKHMPAEDLGAILAGLREQPFVYQEVIGGGPGDAVQASEYTPMGRVTEFAYGQELSSVIRGGQLTWLESFGAAWGLLPDEDALVFIDNHDNQRGHGSGDPLTHADDGTYRVAVAFMLAWPYGVPKLMSSYEIAGGDHGPPREPSGMLRPALDDQGECAEGWVCEHRWVSTLGMVGFRNATDGAPVENWWSNGNDQIAFSRGDRGLFVLNREELPTLEQVFETRLPAGRYCDVVSGGVAEDGLGCVGSEVEVDGDGRAAVTVGPLDALAIHAEARIDD